jgi:anti-sigma regulatory factor (Ser/Thr protein kinase)
LPHPPGASSWRIGLTASAVSNSLVTSERAFPAVAPSVRDARDFVTETLADTPTSLDDLRLMVSELATNVIKHTPSSFHLAVHQTQTEICVEVTDHGCGRPTLLPVNAASSHGRGLQLVSMLSTQWGVRGESEPGKTVWFTVAL